MRRRIPWILVAAGAVGRALSAVRGSAVCQLQFTLSMRLSTSISGVVSRYDYAVFDQQRCLIDDIRPVDYRRMQQDAAAQRAAAPNSG